MAAALRNFINKVNRPDEFRTSYQANDGAHSNPLPFFLYLLSSYHRS